VLVRRDAGGDRRFGGFAGDRGEGFADQAIDAVELASRLDPLLQSSRWLLIGTIPLARPAAAEALRLAVERAVAQAVPLAIDVNWRPTFWDVSPEQALERILPLLRQAALIKLSAEEADWIAGTRDPQRISANLPQAPAVVVTDGGNGMAWRLAGQSGAIGAFAVPVVDTTGAGDACLAGLLHRLCIEPALLQAATAERVEAAMRFASACGALVCREAGAIDPQPTEAEVLTFLESAQSPGA
jgi:fructokinase